MEEDSGCLPGAGTETSEISAIGGTNGADPPRRERCPLLSAENQPWDREEPARSGKNAWLRRTIFSFSPLNHRAWRIGDKAAASSDSAGARSGGTSKARSVGRRRTRFRPQTPGQPQWLPDDRFVVRPSGVRHSSATEQKPPTDARLKPFRVTGRRSKNPPPAVGARAKKQEPTPADFSRRGGGVVVVTPPLAQGRGPACLSAESRKDRAALVWFGCGNAAVSRGARGDRLNDTNLVPAPLRWCRRQCR